MAYDVSSYTPGDGHVTFTADGPVGSAAPAPAAEVVTPEPEVKAETKEATKPETDTLAVEPGEQEQSEQEPGTGEPVVLNIPSFVDAKQVTEERQGFVNDFARLAPDSGIDTATAQGLLDVVTDAAVALQYSVDHANVSPKEARGEMVRLFGEKPGSDLIVAAQAYYKTLSPGMQQYLDNTGLGSDPAVLTSMALAKAGWLKLSPVQATATITRLMGTKEYMAGDKLTQIKIHLLSRIANRGESPEQQLNTAAKAKTGPAALVEHRGRQHEAGIEVLKQEAATLASKKGGMSPVERERFMTIMAKVSQ